MNSPDLFQHQPVLSDAVQRLLAPRAGGVYCDGTVGGGGHSRAILEASAPDGRLVGIDRDPAALAAAREALAEFGERVTLVHGCFADIQTILSERGIDAVDGVLIDVGVSSHQLDTAARGFSFGKSGPLDMRMDPTAGETCLELLRRLDADEIAVVLRDYGEERYHRRISRAIKDHLRADRLNTTADLAALVLDCLPPRERRYRIHPATRTFQALRIAVNGELDQLAAFLDHFPSVLVPGGRCLVISFHSLEDRLVKQRFRALAKVSNLPPDLAEAAGEPVRPTCIILTKRPVTADDAEIAANPRARSAKLRACEKAFQVEVA